MSDCHNIYFKTLPFHKMSVFLLKTGGGWSFEAGL